MGYKKCSLPDYPVICDMWDELASETRPIVVYGMGNGADKLFSRLEKYGVAPVDIFASDGFVRGHSFHGMKVLSFSEIKEKYDDFVILLSFASNREDVIGMLSEINDKYDMYVPDMPVANEEEYFDKDFFNEHYTEIKKAYDSLCDEDSKNAFSSIIRYKLSGRMSYLLDCFSTKDELYSLFSTEKIASVIDVGAYNGDTVCEARSYFPALRRLTAIEPDPKNFKRLLKTVSGIDSVDIRCVNAAAFDSVGQTAFSSSGNRNSTVSATSSFEHKSTSVDLITLDSLQLDADYIKYDVEGAELEALIGSHNTILNSRPALLVSLYHRSRDIFFLINYLAEKYPFYKLTLRRLFCLPAWEIDLVLTV